MDDDFALFYRTAYAGAVRLAWLLTHHHDAAEDVVQDAFVRLRPRLATIEDRKAYLQICPDCLVRPSNPRHGSTV